MSKFGKHRTISSDMRKTILWLESQPEIKRLIFSRIENCRHHYKPGTIRLKRPVRGGFQATIYGGRGATDLFISVNSQTQMDTVAKKIQDRFS